MKSALSRRGLGVIFLVLVVGAVYGTYALFTKKFTDYVRVSVKADQAGLQLPLRADVKLRGIFVGEVLEVTADDGGARLLLGLYADEASIVPANVRAALIPKTLFGEKYVQLQIPDDGADAEPIAEGAVIGQVPQPIEVEDALNALYPLLRTVPPQDINYTLTALADALEGRGDKLGRSFVTLEDYLTRLNPDVPGLVDDLELLGQTADVYSSVAPQLGQILRNSVTTTGTLRERNRQVLSTLDGVTGLSNTTRSFLEQNGDNLIALARLGKKQTAVLAANSAIMPCFFRSIVTFGDDYSGNWRNNTLHINLELLPKQPRGYTASEQPVFGETGKQAPVADCERARRGVWNQQNLLPDRLVPNFDDGAAPTNKRSAPAYAEKPAIDPASGARARETDLDLLLGSTVTMTGPTSRTAEVAP